MKATMFSAGRARRIAVAMILAVLGLAAADGLLLFSGNFHTVRAGELYRSGQPSAAMLDAYTAQYGLKTLINLRGAHPGAAWYDDERRAAARLGLTMIDFPMSADERLTPAKAQALVAMLKAAQKPILVHCKAGADRTGLVSVVYASQIAHVDEETAEWQLSPLYGHIGIPFLSPSFAMDMSWEDLEPLFGIEGS